MTTKELNVTVTLHVTVEGDNPRPSEVARLIDRVLGMESPVACTSSIGKKGAGWCRLEVDGASVHFADLCREMAVMECTGHDA